MLPQALENRRTVVVAPVLAAPGFDGAVRGTLRTHEHDIA
jgi:hypothetical protein